MQTLQPPSNWIAGITAPRVLVLLYHRVDELATDPQLLAVKPIHFEEHLSFLKTSYPVVRLEDLQNIARAGKIEANTVVITFDDGYADNLTNALPLLEKYGLPATVFVTTGVCRNKDQFWWDELTDILLTGWELPPTLDLELDSFQSWDLESTCLKTPESNGWNMLCTDAPTKRHSIYKTISEFLRNATIPQRKDLLQRLRSWAYQSTAGAHTVPARTSAVQKSAQQEQQNLLPGRTLDQAQLKLLGQSPLIEVGSHTVNHPILSVLPVVAQRQELADSKAYLEQVLEKTVKSFAYPYGTRSDYTAATVELVRECGYELACVNIADATWPGSDRLQIPRLLVRDCNGDQFGQWLRAWFGQA